MVQWSKDVLNDLQLHFVESLFRRSPAQGHDLQILGQALDGNFDLPRKIEFMND